MCDEILHISYIYKFPGHRPRVSDEGDLAKFEVVVWDTSVKRKFRV